MCRGRFGNIGAGARGSDALCLCPPGAWRRCCQRQERGPAERQPWFRVLLGFLQRVFTGLDSIRLHQEGSISGSLGSSHSFLTDTSFLKPLAPFLLSQEMWGFFLFSLQEVFQCQNYSFHELV